MIKFTMNNKELKTMMEKASAAINKKATFESIKRVYIQVDGNSLRLLGTDLEIFSEVHTENVWNAENGMIGLSLEEVKLLGKLTADITLQQTEEGKAIIKCGKKLINIPCYENKEYFPPKMEEAHNVITMSEAWALETFTNLVVFTADSENRNKMIHTINLNIQEGRVEALDGYRIAMRTLQGNINHVENLLIMNKGIQVFKKLMDKKSHNDIVISTDGKYIKISGSDFNYYQRIVEGNYFNTKPMIEADFSAYSFEADTENLMEIMKFDYELVKDSRKPVVFTPYNNNLYLYCDGKYEALDQIKVVNLDMKLEAIGFNPLFFIDSLKIANADKVLIRGNNAKSPMMIYADDYRFLLLPINIDNTKVSKIHELIIEGAA